MTKGSESPCFSRMEARGCRDARLLRARGTSWHRRRRQPGAGPSTVEAILCRIAQSTSTARRRTSTATCCALEEMLEQGWARFAWTSSLMP